jgi:hypothetical protein
VHLPARGNPTAYTFHEPVDTIQAAIRKNLWAFGRYEEIPDHYGLPLTAYEKRNSHIVPVLMEPGNELDIALINLGRPYQRSRVYRMGGVCLPLQGWFHLHISAVDANTSRVEIWPRDLEVIVGVTSGFLDPHGPENIYVEVPSTSVEEYEILLAIGGAVGERNMPGICYP